MDIDLVVVVVVGNFLCLLLWNQLKAVDVVPPLAVLAISLDIGVWAIGGVTGAVFALQNVSGKGGCAGSIETEVMTGVEVIGTKDFLVDVCIIEVVYICDGFDRQG